MEIIATTAPKIGVIIDGSADRPKKYRISVTKPKHSAVEPYARDEIRENQRVMARVALNSLDESNLCVLGVILPLSI